MFNKTPNLEQGQALPEGQTNKSRESNSVSKTQGYRKFVVKDWRDIFLTTSICGAIILLAFGFLTQKLLEKFKEDSVKIFQPEFINQYGPIFEDVLIGIVLLPGIILTLKIFVVRAKGIVVDIDNGFIKLPGGGIEFDSLFTKIRHCLQFFRRYEIPLSTIHSVSCYEKTRESKTPEQKREGRPGKLFTTYFVRFSGTFGTCAISFESEGKREQFYTLLVQANTMGVRII